MKKYVLLSALLCLLLPQCQTELRAKRNELIGTISVDPPNKREVLLDTLCSSIRYIKLQTADNIIIPRIYKLMTMKEDFLIFDRLGSNSLFCFDSNGQFRFKIAPEGNGPDEISHLTFVNINLQESEILIYDNMKHKVFTFNNQGELLSVDKCVGDPYPFSGFPITDEVYAFHLNHSDFSEMNLVIGSKDFSTRELAYLPYRSDVDDVFSDFIRSCDGDALYTFGLCDTIFGIDQKTFALNPRYYVDFGSYSVTPDVLNQGGPKGVMRNLSANKGKYAYIINMTGESKRHLMFSYVFDGGTSKNCFIYNKETKEGLNARNFRLEKADFELQSPIGFHKKNEEFISYIQVHRAIKDRYAESFSENYGVYQSLEQALSDSNPVDNPILVLFTMN